MGDVFSRTLVTNTVYLVPWWADERKDRPLPPCRKGKVGNYDGSACDRALCQEMGLRCIWDKTEVPAPDGPLCACGHEIEYEGESECSACRRKRLGLKRGDKGYSHSRGLRCRSCGEPVPDWSKSLLCGRCNSQRFGQVLAAEVERWRK